MLDDQGNRKPPIYVNHVDDNGYCDVKYYMPRTVACSAQALDDVFGSYHRFQNRIISEDKLNLIYAEHRLLLGFLFNSRTMMVILSPRKREKIMCILLEEGWTETKTKATLTEAATINGMIQSAAEFFPWGRAHLLVLQQLLRVQIRKAFARYKVLTRIQRRVTETRRAMPKNLQYRLKHLGLTEVLRAMWNSKEKFTVTEDVRKALRTIYNFLKQERKWETPIGHIVHREPAIISTQDASHLALGVQIPDREIMCLIPYSQEIIDAIKISHKVHINSLEFIAIMISLIIFQLDYKQHKSRYPPHPTMTCFGDNTAANSWVRKIQTESTTGQNLLRYYGELTLHSPVHNNSSHIAGRDNVVADDISRVCELFSPHLSSAHSCPFPTLIRQIVSKYKQMRSWRVFLPSPEVLADLKSILLSDYCMEDVNPPRNLGRFVRVEHILYAGSSSDDYSRQYFPETVL